MPHAKAEVNFLNMLIGSIRSEIILYFSSTSFLLFPILASVGMRTSDLELFFSISPRVFIYSFFVGRFRHHPLGFDLQWIDRKVRGFFYFFFFVRFIGMTES